MAQLYFHYGTMNSGKSEELIKVAASYRYSNGFDDTAKGKKYLVYTTALDTRSDSNKVQSRTGASVSARYINDQIFDDVQKENSKRKVYVVLVDECQFMTRAQVYELTRIVDELHIPVMCFGLKTDFTNQLFEGSQALLEWADKVEEEKAICSRCGDRKANINVRLNDKGEAVESGSTVEVGYDNYRAVCRQCYKELLAEANNKNK